MNPKWIRAPRQEESIESLTRTLPTCATKPLTPEAVEMPFETFAPYYITVRIVLAWFSITHPFRLNCLSLTFSLTLSLTCERTMRSRSHSNPRLYMRPRPLSPHAETISASRKGSAPMSQCNRRSSSQETFNSDLSLLLAYYGISYYGSIETHYSIPSRRYV